MAEFVLYDPLVDADPFAAGFLSYNQLPLFSPFHFEPFPPTSLDDLTAEGAAIFEVDPLVATSTTSGTTLNTSGLNYVISPGYDPTAYLLPGFLGGGATPDNENGETLVLTANEGYAGFLNYDIDLNILSLTADLVAVNEAFPTLDGDTGFVLSFDLAITEEQSEANRAGFSLIAITESLVGVEIGFVEAGENTDYVFVQTATFQEGTTSTVPLEISDTLTYELTVQDGSYSLTADGTTLVSGTLIDYDFDPANSDPALPDSVNPYETENFLFLGDNTDQGYAEFTLGELTLTTIEPEPTTAVDSDFNGDGNPDFFWQNTTTGQLYIWEMDGLNVLNVNDLGVLDPTWEMVGTGDFDQNGAADLVWRNSVTGENYLWYLDDSTVVDVAVLPSIADTAWDIQEVADFDGDGNADLLWRNSATQATAAWLMDGDAFVDYVDLGAVPTDWTIGGAADFDGNGDTDLLWQNETTGSVLFWLFEGDSVAVAELATLTGWDIAGVADLNQDGSTDIMWRNAALGVNLAWFMDGTTPVGFDVAASVADSAWELTI